VVTHFFLAIKVSELEVKENKNELGELSKLDKAFALDFS
jgi:hypothetical protein